MHMHATHQPDPVFYLQLKQRSRERVGAGEEPKLNSGDRPGHGSAMLVLL